LEKLYETTFSTGSAAAAGGAMLLSKRCSYIASLSAFATCGGGCTERVVSGACRLLADTVGLLNRQCSYHYSNRNSNSNSNGYSNSNSNGYSSSSSNGHNGYDNGSGSGNGTNAGTGSVGSELLTRHLCELCVKGCQTLGVALNFSIQQSDRQLLQVRAQFNQYLQRKSNIFPNFY
jgi:hypothetical protein